MGAPIDLSLPRDFSSLVQEHPQAARLLRESSQAAGHQGLSDSSSFSLSQNTQVSTKSTVKNQFSVLGHQNQICKIQGQVVNIHKASTCDGVTTGPWTELFFWGVFLTQIGLLSTRQNVYRVLTLGQQMESSEHAITLPPLLRCRTENITQDSGCSSSSKRTKRKILGTCNT